MCNIIRLISNNLYRSNGNEKQNLSCDDCSLRGKGFWMGMDDPFMGIVAHHSVGLRPAVAFGQDPVG